MKLSDEKSFGKNIYKNFDEGSERDRQRKKEIDAYVQMSIISKDTYKNRFASYCCKVSFKTNLES